MNATDTSDHHGSLEEIATDLDLTRENERLIVFVAQLECRRAALSDSYEVKDSIDNEIDCESLLSR